MPRRAWHPSPEELGPRLLKKSAVQAAIAAGAGTAAITPNEVLARYADIAASDMRDFMAVDKNGGFKVDLKLSQRRDLGHLIKRVRIHKDGSQDIELEPRLPALAKLGEYFNLGKGEAEPQVTLVELAKNLRAHYEEWERAEMQKRRGDDKTTEVVPQRAGAVQ